MNMIIKIGFLFVLTFAVHVNCITAYSYDEPARCNIKVKSYSLTVPCVKAVEGYVQLNGRTVWEAGLCSSKPNKRGVTIITVNPVSCTPGYMRIFDTCADPEAAADLATYLQWLPSESIVVGVTGDEPTSNLGPALRVLRIAGVHVSDVQYRGNFAFVLQKGHPEKTQYVKSITNAVPISKLDVNVVGTSKENVEIVLISKYIV